jgi:NAD+ kinase
LRRIGVLYNPLSDVSVARSVELETWLHDQGKDVWRGISQDCRDCPELLEDMGLMVALGGDGTILRAARLTFDHPMPVLGIALGHLSFMAELGPDEMYDGLRQVFAGREWYDERALVQVTLRRVDQIVAEFEALNEVVISRSDISRVVNAEVWVDGSLLTTYHADGVIVATATGSTAYALSAGGPIVDPRSQALLLVPVAAHLTTVPSMVLHEGAVVTIALRSRYSASLSVDGRETIPLQVGDEIEARRSSRVCTFARVRPMSHFYTDLVRRLRREPE